MLSARQKILEKHFGFLEGFRSAFDLFGTRSQTDILKKYFHHGYLRRSLHEDWCNTAMDLKKAIEQYEDSKKSHS